MLVGFDLILKVKFIDWFVENIRCGMMYLVRYREMMKFNLLGFFWLLFVSFLEFFIWKLLLKDKKYEIYIVLV